MNNFNEYIDKALSLGFSHAVGIDGYDIQCEPEIRAYCNAEQCGNYGSTWVCPPGCGTVEQCQAHADNFKAGIVLQTTGEIPTFGKERRLRELQLAHNTHFLQLADTVRAVGRDVLPLTTGGCMVCKSCTFPKRPCREPDRRMHSLSAYGINVTKLCERAGLEYSFREGFVYFTAYLGLK